MFFLRQIFRAREHMQVSPENPEGYMSVLEHLEALRRTIIRMLLTVLIGMIACFGFTQEIMDFLRYPAERVHEQHEAGLLPAGIQAADWVRAKETAAALPALPANAAQQVIDAQPPQVRQLATMIPLLRAAKLLPQQEQKNWLQAHLPQQAHAQALQLLQADARLLATTPPDNLKLMGAFQPGEAFMLSLQLSFFAGIILAFPVLTYLLMRFIVPGLLEHEKRILYRCVAWGFILFAAGCAFAYWGVLPRVLGFFYEYSLGMGIENDWRIGYYLTFAVKLILIFGLVFELPVIVIPLIKLGILTYPGMKRTRGYALIACFAAALVLAPAPDPGTMLIMALPMYALYELCIAFAWHQHRKQQLTNS
ncbi:MAG: twin-arginine translocase subunit TatC [Akkermansia sp.]|nr:twin-arginine translocase subunit TatC [Akkermansia sp.]